MKPVHALIIDDDSKNANVLARLLGDEGVTNTQLTDSSQLEAFLKNAAEFNIVFLDLQMPGLNGYEVLEKLKADKRFADVPIVACTIYSSEINRAYEVGFDSFIGKPLDPDKFSEQVAHILGGQPIWTMG